MTSYYPINNSLRRRGEEVCLSATRNKDDIEFHSLSSDEAGALARGGMMSSWQGGNGTLYTSQGTQISQRRGPWSLDLI